MKKAFTLATECKSRKRGFDAVIDNEIHEGEPTEANNEESHPEETAAQRKRRREITFLETRKEDRRAHRRSKAEHEPRRILDEAVVRHCTNKEYRAMLKALPRDKPTEDQVNRLNRAKLRGPNYLGRTALQTVGYHFRKTKQASNGFNSRDLLMPAADTKVNYGVHAQLTDLDQGEVAYGIGQHLIWNDPRGDQFLSYSIDLIFLLHHALNRHHEGQREVTIQYLDRRGAMDAYGEPASFYHALDLYEIYNVPAAKIWKGQSATKLYPRKFTQEFLTHGTITVSDARIKPAPIEDLVAKGLFTLFPELEVTDDYERAGLYEGQVAYRTLGYPPGDVKVQRHRRIYSYDKCATTNPMTSVILTLVQKLARCFMVDKTAEPLLHIFLHFLTLCKRPKQDPIFMHWIRTHYTGIHTSMIEKIWLANNVTANDVIDLYDDGAGEAQPGFTRVADNLPGMMQYLDLIRDAITAFGLPELSLNVIESENALTHDAYAGDDARLNKRVRLGKWYDEEAQTDRREKAKQKRNARKELEKGARESAALRTLTDAGTVDETAASREVTEEPALPIADDEVISEAGEQVAFTDEDLQVLMDEGHEEMRVEVSTATA